MKGQYACVWFYIDKWNFSQQYMIIQVLHEYKCITIHKFLNYCTFLFHRKRKGEREMKNRKDESGEREGLADQHFPYHLQQGGTWWMCGGWGTWPRTWSTCRTPSGWPVDTADWTWPCDTGGNWLCEKDCTVSDTRHINSHHLSCLKKKSTVHSLIRFKEF